MTEQEKLKRLLDAVRELLADERRSEWFNDRISIEEGYIGELQIAYERFRNDD